MGGLHTVIFLSFVLALGFLLVILSCALWGNWMPIWSTVAFVLAPMPNVVFGGLAGADSFSDFNNAYIDFGNFVTGMLIMTGIALPLLLSHNDVISSAAALLSLAGGALVYGTMVTYAAFFNVVEDEI